MADGLSSAEDNSNPTKASSKETAKVRGKEMTCDQVVKKYGAAASLEAPELDPKYQQLVASEGQAKGSADYSHKYVDNMDEPDSSLPIAAAGQGAIQGVKDIGKALGVYNDGSDSGGQGAKPKKDNSAAVKSYLEAQDAKSKEVSPAVGLMNSLVGQYQAEMGVVNPYINGSVASQDGALAQKMGASIGGPTQPAPAAAGVADAALKSDAQNYAAANQAGATGVQKALTDTGTADAQALKVSPYLGLLSALQSEATYKQETAAAGGAGLSAPAGAPSWYTQALSSLSASSPTATGGASAVGATPATSATTPSTDTTVTAGGGNG